MLLPDLTTRLCQPEWMDADDVDPGLLRRSLAFIRAVNRLFGYTRATLWHLEQFSLGWHRGETIRLIDFATGSADIPRAIMNWADRRGFNIRIVAVDRHQQTVQAAREKTTDPRIQIIQADVLDLPFNQSEFDYALTAMFLHHLTDDEVVKVLATMSHVARRGIIAADLIRNHRAHAWISLLTLAANPMVKHDARVSVEQAFTRGEVLSIARRAGIDYAKYSKHFGHRFVLAGEKLM